jgi:hypothetical protein
MVAHIGAVNRGGGVIRRSREGTLQTGCPGTLPLKGTAYRQRHASLHGVLEPTLCWLRNGTSSLSSRD